MLKIDDEEAAAQLLMSPVVLVLDSVVLDVPGSTPAERIFFSLPQGAEGVMAPKALRELWPKGAEGVMAQRRWHLFSAPDALDVPGSTPRRAHF